MKMKLMFFSAAFVLTSSIVSAQNARLIGGVNFANVSITDNGKVDDAKMLTAFQVGFVGDLSVAGIFSVQPGILFTGKGTKTQSGDPSTLNYSKATTNPYYIEVPVNFVLKTPLASGKNSSATRFFV